MKLIFNPHFKKRVKKLPKNIQAKLKSRLILFVEDPYNSLLHNHALAGQFQGYRSINITGDYRAVFQLLPEQNAVFFIDIGTHSYLYE